jgi:DNA recombination protein Rad52
MFTEEQRKALAEDLPDEHVKQREAGGRRQVSYLETWRAKDTANRIFGFGEWSYRTLDLVFIGEEDVERWVGDAPNKKRQEGVRVAYRATVQVKVNGVVYSDVGYGEDVSYTSDLQQHELAIKEAVSDGLKRALNPLGQQFGLHLYDKDNPQSRGDHGSGRRRQQQRGPAGPALVTERDIAGIHAHKTEKGLDDAQLHRLIPFIAQDASVTSIKKFPRRHVKALREAIDYMAEHPDDANDQLTEFELRGGPPGDEPSGIPS